jgi:hypothetical protein
MYTFHRVHHNYRNDRTGIEPGIYGAQAASKQALAYDKAPSVKWLRGVSRKKITYIQIQSKDSSVTHIRRCLQNNMDA